MGRKPIGARQRFEVFKRDRFICQYCGSHPPEAILHVDHIIAVANGGQDDKDNLVTACDRCNFGKASVPLSVVPQGLTDRIEEIAERERQIKGYSRILAKRRCRLESEVWSVFNCLFPGKEKVFEKDFTSVKMFIERLGVEAAISAAEIAYSRMHGWGESKRFKYFCGICWRFIKDGKSG